MATSGKVRATPFPSSFPRCPALGEILCKWLSRRVSTACPLSSRLSPPAHPDPLLSHSCTSRSLPQALRSSPLLPSGSGMTLLNCIALKNTVLLSPAPRCCFGRETALQGCNLAAAHLLHSTLSLATTLSSCKLNFADAKPALG